MVEHHLAKVNVAGSSLVIRSMEVQVRGPFGGLLSVLGVVVAHQVAHHDVEALVTGRFSASLGIDER